VGQLLSLWLVGDPGERLDRGDARGCWKRERPCLLEGLKRARVFLFRFVIACLAARARRSRRLASASSAEDDLLIEEEGAGGGR